MSIVGPQTDKKGFIGAVKTKLSTMKTLGQASCAHTQTVQCSSPTNDAVKEVWNISFNNLSGRPFRTYIVVRCTNKNGRVAYTQYPVTIWNSQKEFIDFLLRECDK